MISHIWEQRRLQHSTTTTQSSVPGWPTPNTQEVGKCSLLPNYFPHFPCAIFFHTTGKEILLQAQLLTSYHIGPVFHLYGMLQSLIPIVAMLPFASTESRHTRKKLLCFTIRILRWLLAIRQGLSKQAEQLSEG